MVVNLRCAVAVGGGRGSGGRAAEFRGEVVPPGHLLHEQVLEGLPELSGHAAVDAEVERVAEADAQVHDQDRRLDDFVVQEVVDR